MPVYALGKVNLSMTSPVVVSQPLNKHYYLLCLVFHQVCGRKSLEITWEILYTHHPFSLGRHI